MTNSMIPIPEGYFKYPVRIEIDGKSAGSGFFIENNGRVFLVTARHVVADSAFNLNGKKVEVFAFSDSAGFNELMVLAFDLVNLLSHKLLLHHQSRDIAVIIVGKWNRSSARVEFNSEIGLKNKTVGNLMVAPLSMFRYYKESVVSNDAYLFGYPTSIGIKKVTTNIDFKKPLLRKGVIAGKNEKLKNIVLDCSSFGGNSGGPVVEVEQLFGKNGNYEGMGAYIIGLVTEYVPYEQAFFGLKTKKKAMVVGNSGYSIVEPIDEVIKFLN